MPFPKDALPIRTDALTELALLADGGGKTVLLDTPSIFVGIKTFEPGEVFANHFHEAYDEFFAGLEGTVTVWRGRSSRSDLSQGTSLLCRRGTHHYLLNETQLPARILFAKVPMVQDDTVWVDWVPGCDPAAAPGRTAN
ncbi:cupin domain-containing protein [Arthrobacter sp. S39]|uniref:cupin domain-containing protein n=1 Tax=Arthrobacter sp. S39 TaxID=2509720 RepID=UPI0010372E0B|nr:cupin domain-containing protein [Arthrobacter sp. S39]TAP39569.1 cupin domain-containing protein [Arthrobacter sp. S39]